MRQAEFAFASGIEVAETVRERPGFAFLDSAAPSPNLGRFSFVASDPFGTFVVRGGVAFWNDEPLAGPPLERLRELVSRFRLDAADAAETAPLRGGAIGFVSYDFARWLEPFVQPAETVAGEDLLFHFYDVVITLDHTERRCRVFSSGLPEPEGARRNARAEERLSETLALLARRRPAPSGDGGCGPIDGWSSNFTPAAYAAAVERVREHIAAGDIYQANIAQRFEAALPPGFDHWRFYRELRRANPAPFAAFLSLGERSIASSSPERFLACRDGRVEARPIKGTTARDADPAADAARAALLAASEKDRAENVMIVDLLRNDLSRVCRPGSVGVPALCALESYASVHHLTSVVTGRLRDGHDMLDLMAAAFPCGSITGAPKRRAMDVIAQIEGIGRGVYCGAIGYLGFDGTMDLNVAIRTVALGAARAGFHAGGGVTLLSDPQAEYRETMTKAERIFAAFGSLPPAV